MLGFGDGWIALVYILCFASALLCLVWGALRWNRQETEEPDEEVQQWAQEESRVEQEL